MSDQPELRLTVGDDQAGVRLDVVLAAALGVSRNAVAQRIDAGGVTVDGRPARRSRILARGETVVAAPVVEPPAGPVPALPPVRYRDEHLLIIAKPPGLVVHPGAGHRDDTLVDALRAEGVALAEVSDRTRPGIVHRLDRDTSGLLVVASTGAAYDGLVAMLADRLVVRRYLALVVGVPEESRGVIDAPLDRHPTQRTRFAVVAGGKEARTRYRLLGAGVVRTRDGAQRSVAAVVCSLETGRTHQIRVHLDAVGTPVAGDPVYGADGAVADALGLARPALHAAHLSFPHPVTGQPIAVTEPLPADLRDAWAAAGIPLPDGEEVA